MISGRAHLKGSACTGPEGRKKTGTTDDKKKENLVKFFLMMYLPHGSGRMLLSMDRPCAINITDRTSLGAGLIYHQDDYFGLGL
jgi:hypothetical protein